jgi:hypothetical protein
MKDVISDHSAIGSLTQLAAVGPQDVHIHYGTDDIEAKAFQFSENHNQYTRFGIDVNPVYDVKLTYGTTHKFTIPFQKQHIISNITLKVDFPDISNCYDCNTSTGIHYNNKLAYRLIKEVTFRLDGQIVDKYTGQYLYILHKLETKEGHKEGLETMTASCDCDSFLDGHAKTLYIPLHLWYSRTMKQFFPLLALSKQKFEIEISIEKLENLITCENSDKLVNVNLNILQNGEIKVSCNPTQSHTHIENTLDAQYYIDYIGLDDTERDMYISNYQTYVYNSLVYQNESLNKNVSKVDLHFNIPIKQLIFVIYNKNDLFEFLSFDTAQLIFAKTNNDMMLFTSNYYSLIQDYYHNLCHPYNENIHSYSFALNSGISEHNGAVHFGKLKTKILAINGPFKTKDGIEKKNVDIQIYARGYNVFHTNEGYGKVEFKF